MENIEWLTDWYKSNCDGDWEHSFGIKIETLDNPGWLFEADLTDTNYEGRVILIQTHNSENDWFEINSDGNLFKAVGDSTKLPQLINMFKEFINNA